jgi:hypothetical protein
MTHQVHQGLMTADAVVQAFADASVEFDAGILNSYLATYPQFGDRLKEYVQVWLMSIRATPQEIADQEISPGQVLKAQSRLLAAWESAWAGKVGNDAGEVAKRLDEFSGEKGLGELRSVLLKSADPQEDALVIEYLDPGLKCEPRWINRRLADRLRCPPALVPAALLIHRGQQPTHYSAKEKPHETSLRTWAEAVAELPVSEARKSELLREGE